MKPFTIEELLSQLVRQSVEISYGTNPVEIVDRAVEIRTIKDQIKSRTNESRLSGKDMAQAMSNFVNGNASQHRVFIEEMGKDHRTLQQNFTRLCMDWLRHLAKQEMYDDRNARSVQLAREIVSTHSLYLPLI